MLIHNMLDVPPSKPDTFGLKLWKKPLSFLTAQTGGGYKTVQDHGYHDGPLSPKPQRHAMNEFVASAKQVVQDVVNVLVQI